MINLFAIGEPGQPVRQFVSERNAANIAMQCRSGEVAIPMEKMPDQEMVATISLDGQSITQDIHPAAAVSSPWDSVRGQRDAMIDFNRWKWMPDSPLSVASKAAWLVWANAMHRVTVDFATPDAVVWPTEPAVSY